MKRLAVLTTLGLLGVASPATPGQGPATIKPLDIGSRLELFVDGYLINTMTGVTRELHSPERKGSVFTFDRPWEGGASDCVTVIEDSIPGGAPHYRMYYVGCPLKAKFSLSESPNIIGPPVACTAESRDGIRWTRPSLNLISGEFIDRSGKAFQIPAPNNIVWLGQGMQVHSTDNFVPFKDANPACKPEGRYKAIGRWLNLPDPAPPEPDETGYPWPPGAGLVALQSPDGIHWSLMQEERIIKKTETDAQNVAFWDSARGQYVAYVRVWRKDGTHLRSIARLTSEDFLHWSDPPQWLDFGGAPEEHLYNPTILSYFRASHIDFGFIMRLVPGRAWGREQPEHEISDAVFISSHDGLHFDRSFMEAWIRPGPDPHLQSWVHGNTQAAWGLLETGPQELSVYWIDHFKQYSVKPQLQRGTLRTDGFVSVHANYAGGEFTTKPLTFDGRELIMNFSTSAVGSIRVEIQDRYGNPLPGFALADCPEIYGDAIDEIVKWKARSDVSPLVGQVVRLRIVLKDADLYAIRFQL